MSIRLGLRRIDQLIKQTPSWKAVHLAGTNGKGSVCNYTYQILQRAGLKCGMFSSPHLIDRWDCISIQGHPILKQQFDQIEEQVKKLDSDLELGATPFELLTATAFEAFEQANVEVAVIETGVGGLEDATNIVKKPIATVITKLGLDHEDLLGEGMQSIVNHKAGIMKHQVPCLVDGTMSTDILLQLEAKAKARRVKPFKICYLSDYKKKRFTMIPGWKEFPLHKKSHLFLAYEAARVAIKSSKHHSPDWTKVLPEVINTTFPGRQQAISLQPLTGRYSHVLLDGCHNEQSAQVLSELVKTKYRSNTGPITPVTWVIAASSKKDIRSILNQLIRKGDRIITTEFGAVDGMPWVSPMAAQDISQAAASLKPSICEKVPDVLQALRRACKIAEGMPLVVAGSLYLISDVLRLLRDATEDPDANVHQLENEEA